MNRDLDRWLLVCQWLVAIAAVLYAAQLVLVIIVLVRG